MQYIFIINVQFIMVKIITMLRIVSHAIFVKLQDVFEIFVQGVKKNSTPLKFGTFL